MKIKNPVALVIKHVYTLLYRIYIFVLKSLYKMSRICFVGMANVFKSFGEFFKAHVMR